MNYLFNCVKISFANILKVLSLQINAYAVKIHDMQKLQFLYLTLMDREQYKWPLKAIYCFCRQNLLNFYEFWACLDVSETTVYFLHFWLFFLMKKAICAVFSYLSWSAMAAKYLKRKGNFKHPEKSRNRKMDTAMSAQRCKTLRSFIFHKNHRKQCYIT